jgi:hypothetical protein
VHAGVTVGNFAQFRLISAVETNLLTDVFHVLWALKRPTDGQTEGNSIPTTCQGSACSGVLTGTPGSRTISDFGKLYNK